MSQSKHEFVLSSKNKTGKDFKKITGDLRGVEIKLGDVAGKMRSMGAVGVKAVGGAAVAAGVAIVAMTVKAAEAAGELQNLSRVAGASTTELQLMASGARLVGVEQDKLADILKDTNDKLGDFLQTGGGAATDFFENIAPKIGVTAESFKDLSGPDALQLYYSSLEKANLSQQEMTFYMEAIASDSTLLIPLLKNGGAAMSEQADKAERLGLVLSEMEIGALGHVEVKIKNATAGIGAFTQHLGAKFAPIIGEVSDAFMDAVESAGGFGEISTKVFNTIITGVGLAANVVRGLHAVFIGVQGIVVRVAEDIVNMLAMIENGWREIANLIPGVTVKTTGYAQELKDTLTSVRTDIQDQFLELAAEPMPSEKLAEWAEEATVKVQEAVAAAKVAEVEAGEGEELEAPAVDQEVLDRLSRMETLKELKKLEIANDAESEELAYLNRQQMLLTSLENEQITKDSFKLLDLRNEEKYQNALLKLDDKTIKTREMWEKMSAKNKTKFVLGQMTNLMQEGGKKNKAMFEAGKLASIANATINTYEAATGAYSAMASIPFVGPALGAAAAAAAVVSGMAQVSSIQSQSFGGGGGGGSAGSSAPSVGVPSLSSSPSSSLSLPEADDDEPEEEKARVIDITLNVEEDALLTGQTVRRLMEEIGDEAGYNVKYG
jgi:hypothetical protein